MTFKARPCSPLEFSAFITAVFVTFKEIPQDVEMRKLYDAVVKEPFETLRELIESDCNFHDPLELRIRNAAAKARSELIKEAVSRYASGTL